MSTDRGDEGGNERPVLLRNGPHDRPGRWFGTWSWHWVEFKRLFASMLWHDKWHRYTFLVSCAVMVLGLIYTAIWE